MLGSRALCPQPGADQFEPDCMIICIFLGGARLTSVRRETAMRPAAANDDGIIIVAGNTWSTVSHRPCA